MTPRNLGYMDEEGVYHGNKAMEAQQMVEQVVNFDLDLDQLIDQAKEKMQPRTLGYIDEDGNYHGNEYMA